MPILDSIFEKKLNRIAGIIDFLIVNKEYYSELSEINYNEEKLQEGKSLYKKYLKLKKKCMDVQNRYYSASIGIQKAWEKSNTFYERHLAISRIAFHSEPEFLHKLGINKYQSISLTGWLMQANHFYLTILSDMKNRLKLNSFGITKADLEFGKNSVDTLMMSFIVNENYDDTSRSSVKDCDRALDNSWKWMSKFIDTTQHVFAKNSALRKKFNIDEFFIYK